jgi:hypothetical protein
LARREFVWINVTAHSTTLQHRLNADAQGQLEALFALKTIVIQIIPY